MFSVVIPVYNKTAYLSKAIQSVKEQTIADWELLLIDDGSTDSSLQIIKDSFVGFEQRIKFFSQANQGVSIARNNGVGVSQYDYIAFLMQMIGGSQPS